MKRTKPILLFLIIINCVPFNSLAQSGSLESVLKIDLSKPQKVSPIEYGWHYEEIGMIGDGGLYAEMIDCMDQNIGKILNCIEKRGQLVNTFILFFSDNGDVQKVASNGDLRGWKLTPYQG